MISHSLRSEQYAIILGQNGQPRVASLDRNLILSLAQCDKTSAGLLNTDIQSEFAELYLDVPEDC